MKDIKKIDKKICFAWISSIFLIGLASTVLNTHSVKAVSGVPIQYIRVDDNTHVAVVDFHDPKEVCFLPYIAKDSLVGSRDKDGSLLHDFHTDSFETIMKDENIKRDGAMPALAINTDFISARGAPLSINFIQGYNYSGPRRWSSLALSKNNNASIVTNISDDLYNVSGGGPRIYDGSGVFTPPRFNELGFETIHFKKERSLVGITDQKKMIFIVSSYLEVDEMRELLEKYGNVDGGRVMDGLMFDGGASPSMYVDGKVVHTEGGQISTLLLTYTGASCAKDK